MRRRIAYIPLNTYPSAASDAAILATLHLAETLGHRPHVATFSVDIPQVVSPLGGYLIDVEGLVRAAEERSKAESDRLHDLIRAAASDRAGLQITHHKPLLGGTSDAATVASRLFDLVLLPWSADDAALRDMAQSLIFGSGLPVILVPPDGKIGHVDHIAIGWDESRVAARALADALALLPVGGKVTVLTVVDEKALRGSEIAETLAASLDLRGYAATTRNLTLGGRTIAERLQDAAISEGAQLLVMGGFGHSRLRDFILGGATDGVLGDLRLATLLAH